MPTEQSVVGADQLTEYETLLRMLPGVLHARIKLDEGGGIAEIHVLASQTRSPKQLVRDIQSALIARYDLEIDHRAVSIAQIDMEDDGLPAAEQVRLLCRQVASSHRDGVSSAQVTLSCGQREFVGEASDAVNHFSRRMTVARATLEAVHAFLGQRVFSAVEVKFSTIADWNITTVAVGHQRGDRTELLLGSVYSDELDVDQSIVKATLDAINRRVCLLAP